MFSCRCLLFSLWESLCLLLRLTHPLSCISHCLCQDLILWCVNIDCSSPEVVVGCCSGGVDVGFSVTGVVVSLGADGVPSRGVVVDSCCRTGSNWYSLTNVDSGSCHSPRGTGFWACNIGFLCVGVYVFCRSSELGIKQSTASHRAKIGFIGLPF